MPHVALLAGFLTFGQFLAVFFFVSALTSWLFVTYLGQFFALFENLFAKRIILAAAQFFCLYRGQTRMEYLLVSRFDCLFLLIIMYLGDLRVQLRSSREHSAGVGHALAAGICVSILFFSTSLGWNLL